MAGHIAPTVRKQKESPSAWEMAPPFRVGPLPHLNLCGDVLTDNLPPLSWVWETKKEERDPTEGLVGFIGGLAF